MTAITFSHKIRLVPTNSQEDYFRRACGVARFTYNWALDEWKKQYDAGKKPNALALKKQFNAIKPHAFPWIYEVTKYASQQPFFFLQNAFQRFFKKQARYPQFKRKGVHDSFYVGNDQLKVEGDRIRLPKLGWVRMREVLRFGGKILAATVSRIANQWYVSLHVELAQPPKPCETQASVGVDLGINTLATLFDGHATQKIEGAKPLRKALKRLKRMQRRLSRKVKGANNRHKQRMRVARLHARIRFVRQDALHKLTTKLAQNYACIVLEDLNVKGMMANHRLARHIADMGFYEFRRQLEYKAKLYGSHIEVADRWFPSSKRCSCCGEINHDLTLKDRLFHCGSCDLSMDRDENAARNLLNTVSSTEFQACGEEGAGSSICLSETGLCEAGI